MKKETIIINRLRASEGMVVTNGTSYGKVVRLAEGQADDAFFEITIEEYERILAEKRAKEHSAI